MGYISAILPSGSLVLVTDRHSLPIGTTLVISLDGGLASIHATAAAVRLNPWCPICVMCPIGTGERIALSLTAFSRLETRPVFVDSPLDEQGMPSSLILEAVRQAPGPKIADLVEFVIRRTGRSDLTGILRQCMTTGAEHESARDKPSRSTICRRFQSFGALTARDWRALAQTILTVTDRKARREPREGLAYDVRALRERCRNLFDLSLRQAEALAGWESLLETSLLVWGYTASPTQEGLLHFHESSVASAIR